MRILPSLFLPCLLSIFSFALLLTGCQQPSLQKALFGSCKSTQQEQAQKNIKDLHQRFEISIPSDWKKEFFIDSSSTRFYCADTTKDLTDTYIVEIGHYLKNTTLDTLFVKKIEDEVLQKKRAWCCNQNAFVWATKKDIASIQSTGVWVLNFRLFKVIFQMQTAAYTS